MSAEHRLWSIHLQYNLKRWPIFHNLCMGSLSLSIHMWYEYIDMSHAVSTIVLEFLILNLRVSLEIWWSLNPDLNLQSRNWISYQKKSSLKAGLRIRSNLTHSNQKEFFFFVKFSHWPQGMIKNYCFHGHHVKGTENWV